MNSLKQELYMQSLEKHMSALLQASQAYDKAILSLSTASLGFTFAFINFINHPNHSCLLPFTWFFLIIAMALTLISFLIDQIHSAHRVSFNYWRITSEGKKIDDEHWTDAWLFLFPILSGTAFAIGITLFAIFVSISV